MEQTPKSASEPTTVRLGYVKPKDWKTLDEIIGDNVERLRKARGLEVPALAKALGVGRSVVYDMEGFRKGRRRREFKWSDLVALCGALETTVFELVLPVDDQKVAGLEDLPGMIPDQEGMRNVPPFAEIGRDGLSARLFGAGPAMLSPEALENYAKKAKKERTKRDEAVQELASNFINEFVSAFQTAAADALAAQSSEEE